MTKSKIMKIYTIMLPYTKKKKYLKKNLSNLWLHWNLILNFQYKPVDSKNERTMLCWYDWPGRGVNCILNVYVTTLPL